MPTDNALWDVQTALYTRLTGGTALCALLPGGAAGIYDHVPQDAGFPRVVLGAAKAVPLEGAGFSGSAAEFEIETCSRAAGMKETRALMAEVRALLHAAEFSVPHQTLVLCRLMAAETYIAAEPAEGQVLRHGRLRFHIVTEPA